MPKHNIPEITMTDALDYVEAVQAMYSLNIIVELRPGVMGTTGKWQVTAKAYNAPQTPVDQPLLTEMVTYPSSNHKTFAGALLGSVMRLEQHLQAYHWLIAMGHDPS